MSRTVFSALIAALLVSAAVAQSTLNVPLLPMYNFVQSGSSASYTSATTAAVRAGIFAFTTDSKGVWAMNATGPSNIFSTYYDALAGVSQLIPLGNSSIGSVIAIAGTTIALYQTNATAVWRAATFVTKNATFDIRSDSNSATSSIYPAFVQDSTGAVVFVIGTQNTSNVPSGTHLPSTIYALSTSDLSLVWSVVVNSDTTNFGMVADSTYVWFLAQNLTTSYTDYFVQKVYIVNGSLSAYNYDTGFGDSTLAYLNVANGQLFVMAYYGYKVLLAADGTELMRESGSAPSCSTMPYQPVLVNSSWLVLCGYYFYSFDNTTGAKTTFTASDSYFRCGAIHSSNGDVVLVAGETVYVRNASGVQAIATLGTSSLQCSGAVFGPTTTNYTTVNPADVVFISGSNAVVAVNYRTGVALAQVAGDVNPLGAAAVDLETSRVFIASTDSRSLLQGYDFVSLTNTTSFVADFSSGSSSTTFSIAYNATNESTYYVSSRSLHTVDKYGNKEQLGTFGNYISVQVQPTIVGQYLVILDTYYSYVYVYDSVTKTLGSGVSTCSVSESVLPIVTGTKFILFCGTGNGYGSTAANLLDASTGKLDTSFTPKSSDSYPYGLGGVVVDGGKTLILATSLYEMRAFDISSSPASSATVQWTLSRATGTSSGIQALTSLPVVYDDKVYFTATGYFYPEGTQSTLFTIPATGDVSTVTPTTVLKLGATNSDSVFKTLSVKTGGSFGTGMLYVIGATNITAVSLVSEEVVFNYKHNGTIQSKYQGTPVVLDASGAICFFDSNSQFVVVGGFEGGLAWTYPATSNYYAVATDNTSVYFSDGTYVVGANIWSGAVSSVSTYGSGSTQGFAVAAGQNSSTVIGATSSEYVFANQVWSYYDIDVTGTGATSFPGSGSSAANGGSSGSSSSSSKAWIAGVVIGVVVVIAAVFVVAKRSSQSDSTFDQDYVPMNPTTQV